MKKVAKKLETSVAELIILSVFLAIFLSSCAQTTYLPCAAYASVDCENCDEID